MSEGLEHGFTPQGGAPRWLTIAVIVLAGVSLVSIGLAWSASSRASSAQTAASTTIKQNLDTLNQRLAKADEANAQIQSQLRGPEQAEQRRHRSEKRSGRDKKQRADGAWGTGYVDCPRPRGN